MLPVSTKTRKMCRVHSARAAALTFSGRWKEECGKKKKLLNEMMHFTDDLGFLKYAVVSRLTDNQVCLRRITMQMQQL